MPYIEGSKMDWTVNDALYHRFLKWHLKCENIMECELVALLEWQKYKKVIAWSGDFGMDQFVSWGLSSEDFNLDTIWGKYEEFCKPMKCVPTLILLQASGKEVEVWMTSIVQCKQSQSC